MTPHLTPTPAQAPRTFSPCPVFLQRVTSPIPYPLTPAGHCWFQHPLHPSPDPTKPHSCWGLTLLPSSCWIKTSSTLLLMNLVKTRLQNDAGEVEERTSENEWVQVREYTLIHSS